MNENEKKQSNSKTLSLRGGGGSSVRMNLSHGRSKSVLIETKRKKIILTNKTNPSQTQKEKDAFKLEGSNKTNENVFTEEQIDRRKKAIEAAREREILIKEEQEKLKKEKVLENENRIIEKEAESYKKLMIKQKLKLQKSRHPKIKINKIPNLIAKMKIALLIKSLEKMKNLRK